MNRPVRVLWLVKGLGRGGAEQLLVNLAGALDPREVRLDVAYVLPHKHALVEDLRARDVRVECLAGDGHWWPRSLHRLLGSEAYSVVHTHSPVLAAAARLLAPRTARLVHTEHNMWERYRPLTRRANALTYSRNAMVWAVSQGVADSIRPWRVLGAPPVSVLHHGLLRETDARSACTRREARARLGLEGDGFVVGTVGNLTAKKDHATLVSAFGRVHTVLPGSHLVLVGGGPLENRLRELVVAEGLADAVHLVGRRADVAEILPAFDVFAMSSRYEGLSIALLEAMDAGVAPVVTAVGGLPEVVVAQESGLLVPPGNPAALGDALLALALDPARRHHLAAGARTRAADFDISPAAATLAACYRELSERRTAVRVP